MNAVDTNVLFYARDSRFPQKQQTARQLIAQLQDGALMWQVACEYLATSRKLDPQGVSREDAFEDILRVRRIWRTVLSQWSILDRAGKLHSRYALSTWDGLLIAACLEGGVHRLYTEDFDAYREIDSLEIVNPFRE